MKVFRDIYNSNSITLSRALFALCFLVTLIFTPLYDLFPSQHIKFLKDNINGLNHLNIFLWFDNIIIPYIISIIVLIISIIGIYPRIFIFFQSWISYSIYYSMLVTEGGDQINVIITFLLIPVFIFDNRSNGWKIRNNINIEKPNNLYNNLLLYNAFLAIFFIKLQISILYLNAGISKIFAPEWSNGTAVYYWFYDPAFGAPYWFDYLFGFLFKNNLTVSLINWGVIILELLLFSGLFIRQKKKYILFLFGFLFHFMIVVVHGLPSFWISMTGCLVLYLFKLDLTVKQNLLNVRRVLTKIL